MSFVVELLINHTWWSFDDDGGWFTQLYSWFNVIEGCVWLLCAALVTRRYVRHRHSSLELLYAVSFLTFGLSDFRESYVLESWLLLFKTLNLATLLYLRSVVLRKYYPQAKVL